MLPKKSLPPNSEQVKASYNNAYQQLLARKAILEEQMVEIERAIAEVRARLSAVAEFEKALKAEETEESEE